MASEARADDRHWTGASPCTLVEGVPGDKHPVRRTPSVAAAVNALTKAGFDPAKNAKAHDLFVKALDGLYTQSEKAFALPKGDRSFQPGAAQRFLNAHVLAAGAPLRVGLERFEPSPEVAALMALAACRANRYPQVIELGRQVTLPESASLRAFGVLLLLELGEKDEARALLAQGSGLPDDGFLAPYVKADLAASKDERLVLHALARRRAQNGDQELAWKTQSARVEVLP